jgi:hypothetical protein
MIGGGSLSLKANERGREGKSMKGNCIDCGEEYDLDVLNLDLRCAACVEQWVIDELLGDKV